MILRNLFKPKPAQAEAVYAAIVAATRQPSFYTELDVPDTIDGRFDLLVVHLWLIIARLNGVDNRLRQQLIDVFCVDMDDNIRELGAGDLGVSKKVRHMAEAFQGRYVAYEAAPTHQTMMAALQRNVYAGAANSGVHKLTGYVLAAKAHLHEQSAENIIAGKFVFR